MAVPKRKTSVSRKKMRRSHHKLPSVNIIEDKKSGEYKLSHHIDLKSGYYNGKKILDITRSTPVFPADKLISDFPSS